MVSLILGLQRYTIAFKIKKNFKKIFSDDFKLVNRPLKSKQKALSPALYFIERLIFIRTS